MKIFKFCIGSQPKLHTMNDSPLQLVETDLSFETKQLLEYIALLASITPDTKSILNRFVVQCLTHCKDSPGSPEHEFIIVDLIDTHRKSGSSPLHLILERTASPNQAPDTYFLGHPDSAAILDSLVQTMKDMPADLLASFSGDNASSSGKSSSTYRLLPSDTSISLSSTKSLHTSTIGSTSFFRQADDRFLGSKNLEHYAKACHNVRQIRPLDLSLFDLVVLADTVHKHDPIYSVFKSQCFWFASSICDVVIKEYTCTTVNSQRDNLLTPPPGRDDICLPPNDYLPNLAGTWMGIAVNRVEDAVSSVLRREFRRHRQQKLDEGSVLFIIYDATCLFIQI